MVVCAHGALPGRVVVGVGRRVHLHIVARRGFADDEDDGAGRFCRERFVLVDREAREAVVVPQAVHLRLLDVAVDVAPKGRDRRLRQVDDERRRRRTDERGECAHAGRGRLIFHAAGKREVRAREEKPKRGERGEDEERPPGADVRLDEVDALAPIREVERHERGGREAVPHDAVVGDLRERDQEGGDVEQPHESRDDARVADAEKRGGKRGKQDDFCRADEEVVANFRSVPVLCVRPRVEQRERHAP